LTAINCKRLMHFGSAPCLNLFAANLFSAHTKSWQSSRNHRIIAFRIGRVILQSHLKATANIQINQSIWSFLLQNYWLRFSLGKNSLSKTVWKYISKKASRIHSIYRGI
jgi:hypothetical protein